MVVLHVIWLMEEVLNLVMRSVQVSKLSKCYGKNITDVTFLSELSLGAMDFMVKLP